MTAMDHLEHLSKVLLLYGKTCDSILCLLGDNCSNNQLMGQTLKVPFIGCASHKFNLAVRKLIAEQPDQNAIIQKVSTVMKKTSTLKIAAQRCEFTDYKPIRENKTRWLSTYQMIKYLKIQIKLSSAAELLYVLPNHVEVDLLSWAFENLKKFDQVTVMLQRSDNTFLEAQEIFNLFLTDFPDFEGYLADDARIVENKVFEKAVLGISKGLPLTDEQRHAASI